MMDFAGFIGTKRGLYENESAFIASLDARARFEAPLIDAMYASAVKGKIENLLRDPAYAGYNDSDVEATPPAPRTLTISSNAMRRQFCEDVPPLIDGIVNASKRSVDTLLYRTQVRHASTDDPTYRLQMENIGGILHYIEANDSNNARQIVIEIPRELVREEWQAITEACSASAHNNNKTMWTDSTSKRTLETSISIGDGIFADASHVVVRIPARRYQYGQLVGSLQIGDTRIPIGDGTRKYTYAVPDAHELQKAINANTDAADAEGVNDIEKAILAFMP